MKSPPRPLKTILATVVAMIVVAAVGATAFIWSGVYNIAAGSQHTQPVYSLLEQTMQQSVRLRASGIVPPALTAPELFERGALCYRDRCEQCHGGPGVAQHDIALGMQPLPGPLMNAPMRWKTRELYWITRNGITMSGMPAWRFRLADDDLWALVAFVERLPALSPHEYRDVIARQSSERCKQRNETAVAATVDPDRGHEALAQYGCNGCHLIPGVTGSQVHVGPPLAAVARRQLIAGQVANTPENMARWIRNPRGIDPLTAMPDLGVTERDARDIAAYLATLL
jgi:mono/diheme cytochrome c family protein